MRKLIVLCCWLVGCGPSIAENTQQCEGQPGQILNDWTAINGWKDSSFTSLSQFCNKEGDAVLSSPLARVWLTKRINQPGQTDFSAEFDTLCRDGWLWIGDDPNDQARQTRVPLSSVSLSYHVRRSDVTYYIAFEAGNQRCPSVLLRNVEISYTR